VATEDNVPTLDEEAIYAEALSELKSGTVRPGLWAKAFAESEGDENKSQALYIRLRVQHENERRRQLQDAAAASAADSVRRKAEEFSAVIERLRLKGYDARKSGDGWIVREPLGGRAKLDSDKLLLEYAEGRVSVASRQHGSPDKHLASPTGKERQPDQKPSRQPRTMSRKNVWYVVLGILPMYGAYNSIRSFGEPWSGLAAGLIVAAVFYGLGKSALFLVRKFRHNR
jgi:hypothetical protein